jgi:N-terminal acetyltransferase B complex non-catalytic subunit
MIEQSSCSLLKNIHVTQLRHQATMRYGLVVSSERVRRLTYVQEKSQGWVSAEVNVLTFTYLESLVVKAIKLAQMSPDNHDVGFIVVYSLLNLHEKVVSQQGEDTKASDGIVRNSRLLLQATMLARALVERDAEKQNRKLGLISARLHLNLGLGKTAFRQWRHAKCKEMLIDTLSPYLLSRISQTHPFDVRGHQGFAADKELDYTISTIERMEDKQEELLFSSIKRFLWDSAIDQLRFKGKLRSSLTKNMCAIERRRIARLKGESAGDLPEIDYSSKFGHCTHSVHLYQADFDRLS